LAHWLGEARNAGLRGAKRGRCGGCVSAGREPDAIAAKLGGAGHKLGIEGAKRGVELRSRGFAAQHDLELGPAGACRRRRSRRRAVGGGGAGPEARSTRGEEEEAENQ